MILLLQRVTVRRALRPLENARKQIAQLQQGKRSQLETQVPQELEPLVAQINHLLAHTEDSLKRSRNALGNLGHALKTPLAVLLSLASDARLDDHPQLRNTELPSLLATLGMIHGDHLSLSHTAPPGLQLPWDREDLLELLVSIEDDGPGIPEQRRDEVFSRGARLDEQTTGHGLGLGIVRDIVEAWGAQMRLLSSPLGGLLVMIDLPRRS